MTAEHMSVDEYARTTSEIRRLQSQLAESELKMIREYLDPHRIARIAKLQRRAELDARMGAERLKAATAESADYDRRQNDLKKAQHDSHTKQRKDDTTQTATSRARAASAQKARSDVTDDGQEALSCSVTSIHAGPSSRPARRAHSASA